MKQFHSVFFLIIFIFISVQLFTQPTQWLPRGIGGGGALFSPSFSPTNTNELYVACDMSELFRSTNFGVSWDPVNFNAIQGGSNSKVQFTASNPQILYCINHKGDVSSPQKSTNGGASWFVLPGDPTGEDASTLYSDIGNPNNVILTDYTRLWFSTNGGTTFSLKYTSTDPGGCYAAGVLFDTTSIYVGTNEGILTSINSGSTFTMNALTGIPSTQGLLSFSGAQTGSIVRFYGVAAEKTDIYVGIPGSDYWDISRGVYVKDGSGSWALRMGGIVQGTDFLFYVSTALNNINTAYIGGSNSTGFPTVFKTTNGGLNWVNTFITTQNQNIFTGWSGTGGDRGWGYGECAMGFAVAPYDANRIAISDFGFVHLSSSGGNTWNQAYVTQATQNPMNTTITPGKNYSGNGLENTSCWWLTWTDANNIFASFSDIRGVRSTSAGALWSFNYTGHTLNTMYYTLKHPNGMLYGAASSVHDMYQSTYLMDTRIDGGSGTLLMSSNNGLSWQLMHNFAHPVIWLARDPNNANRMYASVIHSSQGGIFISNDIQNGAASTWTRVALPPRTEGHPFNVHVLNDGTLICTYSGRRNSAGTFMPSSGVFVSTNQGTSWSDRSHSGMYYWTKDLVIYPHDASQNTWYAGVFSGWGGPPNGLGGLYRTTNRGVNWIRINNADRVTSCTFSPTNADIAYMTTEITGLWYSNNVSSANPVFTQVTSYPFRQPERVFFNPHNTNEVWITSFGNGMRVGNSTIGITPINSEIPDAYALEQNYPNPFNPVTRLKFQMPKPGFAKIAVFDLLGREVHVLADQQLSAGIYEIEFDGSNFPSGVYFYRLTAGEFSSSKKMILVR